MRSRIAILAVLAALVAAPTLFAQGVQTGTLQGTVTDGNGDALPGVLVTADSPKLQGQRTTTTGANGAYILRGLPSGDYTVTFELDGFNTVQRSAVLEIGRPARSDAELELSTVTETIVVTSRAANALETTTGGANYDAEEIDSLPVTRDLDGIAINTPGVNGNTPQAGQVTISGGFGYDNAFLVDGVDVNDNVFGNPDNLFIEDAIEETQVLTSGISAEYGRFSGGVVNAVTKAGGNEFHGGGRVDLDNPQWRDETPIEDENGTTRPNTQNETYTATLGGFVLQDKLWFFAAGRDAETTTSRTLTQTNIPFDQMNDDTRWEGKLTANINDRHNLQATYTDAGSSAVQRATVASSTLDTIVMPDFPNTLVVGRYSGILTDRLFAEAQYSEKEFAFENFGGTSTEIRDSPFRCWNISACQYNAPLFDANDPEDRNNEQIAASLSWFLDSASAGSHDIKIGGEDFTSIRTGGNSNSATDWVLFHDFALDASGNPILDANGKAIPTFRGLFTNPQFGIGVFFESFRGSEVSITTRALYVNDSWQLNDHWSFNLGVRYEDVTSDADTGTDPVNTDGLVPRLAAVYDIRGDGKYRVEATYGEYIGGYNMSLFTSVTNTGNPNYVYGPYIGPDGDGLGFDPGFDPNNYFFTGGSVPTLNVFHDPNLSAPTQEEYTLSFGMALPKAGFLKARYINRELTDVVENFTTIDLGASSGSIQGVPIQLDNKFFRNTDLAFREYEAIILQGRYNPLRNLVIEGHWTHQLSNDGNYEGEAGNGIGPAVLGPGDFPEMFDERNYAAGRLDDFQEDLFRIWGIYSLDLGRAGNLAVSAKYNYFSGLTQSLSTAIGVTAQQNALNPGYVGPPTSQTIFFGERGAFENDAFDRVDFAFNYQFPIWNNLRIYAKGELFNAFNDDTQIAQNVTVNADFNGPLDSLGRPLNFTQASSFGNARSSADYQTPREYRFSLGFRF